MRPTTFAIALFALGLVGCSNQNGTPGIPTLTDAAATRLPAGKSKPKVISLYHGCPLYASPNDSVINYNVTSQPVDVHNNAIMTHLGALQFTGGDTAPLEIVNLGNWLTPTYVVGAIPTGHPTPIQPGIFGGGAGATFPWRTGFMMEGSIPQNCSTGNCHVVTLITQKKVPSQKITCTIYEAYRSNWTGLAFSAYDGIIDKLASDTSYIYQIINKQGNVTAAGIPLYGFTDWADELGATIDHPVGALLPETAVMMPPSSHTNYSPRIATTSGTCTSNCLAMGDILRLKPGVACPVGTKAVCTQLKTYGAVVTDVALQPEFRLGRATDGSDRWVASASLKFLTGLKLSNFDVVVREPMSYFVKQHS